jgi:NAD(P)-dependent dehydrogenase (short-subunit alcohol dehydrogenase family)
MSKEKVVVIVGGAGLLGKQFSHAVAEAGAKLVIADLNFDNAKKLAKELCDQGLKVEPGIIDITSRNSISALISSVHNKHGKIDAVVNNAYPRNSNYGRKLEEVTYSDFCENISLHAGGYFQVMQQFALYFKDAGGGGGGNIVNIASIYGFIAPRFEVYEGTTMTMPVEYAAIKSAVLHLTRYFAQYYKTSGIRVNALSPGGILDQQSETFVGRYNAHCGPKGMLDGSDISGTLLFLLSDASLHITGQNLVVDDGFTL